MAAPRWNIVLIMLDDVAWPAFDKMARLASRADSTTDGNWVRFPYTYVNYALCGPSRFSAFTGRYGRHHGGFSHFTAWSQDERSVAMCEQRTRFNDMFWWLNQSGYTVGLFGKYMNEEPFLLGDDYVHPGVDKWDVASDDHSLTDPIDNNLRNPDGTLNSKYKPTGSPVIAGHNQHKGPDYGGVDAPVYYRNNQSGSPQPSGTTDPWTGVGATQGDRVTGPPPTNTPGAKYTTGYWTDLYSYQIRNWLHPRDALTGADTGSRPPEPWFTYYASRPGHRIIVDPSSPFTEIGVAQRHRGLNSSVFDYGTGGPVAIGPPGAAFDPAGFNEADISDKPTWFRATYGDTAAGNPYWIGPPVAAAQRREVVAQFRALQSMDEFIYDLLKQLGDDTSPNPVTGVVEPIIDHTVFMVTNDNGYQFGSNRAVGKTTPLEGSIRTNLIVRWPDPAIKKSNGGVGPHIDNALVSLVDIAPTLAAVAGVKPTRAFDGMDLRPRIMDPTAGWRREVRGEFNSTNDPGTSDVPHHSWVVANYPDTVTSASEPYDISPRMKYSLIPPKAQTFYDGGGDWTVAEAELYDLTNDPGESTNRASDATGNWPTVNADLARRRTRLHSI